MNTKFKPGQLIKLHGKVLRGGVHGETLNRYVAIRVPYETGSGYFYPIVLEHIGMFLGDFSHDDNRPPTDQEHFQALFGATRVWIDATFFMPVIEDDIQV